MRRCTSISKSPFFLTKVNSIGTLWNAVVVELRVSRSRGTLILAWFMLIVMWALALSVLGGLASSRCATKESRC